MLEEDSEVFDSETVAHWAKMADEILADFLKVLSRHGSEAECFGGRDDSVAQKVIA